MHIGVDARELAGHRTGVGRYLLRLLEQWGVNPAARRHRFTLFVPRLDATLPGGLPGDIAVVEGAGGTLWEQGALARALRRASPDVFFAPGYTAPLLSRTPFVVTVHDVSFAAHPEWFRRREAVRRRWLARAAVTRARSIVTVSEFSRQEIVRLLGAAAERVHVVTHGVDAAAGPPAAREPLVLYVGSIFTRRHVPVLIEAFARLARDRPELRLTLVGEDRSWPPVLLARAIDRSGVRERIRHVGWVPDIELASLYARASAFVFLSSYEGFGLTPLEALAAGVPPVVLDTPVAREIYGSASIRVGAPDPSVVARALASALDEGPVRSGVLAAAGPVLARYRWSAAAEQTLSLLEGVTR